MTSSPLDSVTASDATGAAAAAGDPQARRRDARGTRRTRARALGWAFAGVLVAGAAAAASHVTSMMTSPAPPSDVGTVKTTAAGRYRVLLAPATTPVPLHRLHRWTVRVERASGAAGGAPAAAPVVSVDGGMPHHGHGLPTTPRVTGRLPDGRLVVDGVKFSMPGWWVLRLRVSGEAGTDSVTFNVDL